VLSGITTQSRARAAIFRRLKSARAERVIRLLYAETVTGAGGDCSFSLLVSNFDTFSRAQFFALAREGIHRRVSDFLVQRCKALVPIQVRADTNDGAISDIFFHHRRRLQSYGAMSLDSRAVSPTDQ